MKRCTCNCRLAQMGRCEHLLSNVWALVPVKLETPCRWQYRVLEESPPLQTKGCRLMYVSSFLSPAACGLVLRSFHSQRILGFQGVLPTQPIFQESKIETRHETQTFINMRKTCPDPISVTQPDQQGSFHLMWLRVARN